MLPYLAFLLIAACVVLVGYVAVRVGLGWFKR